MPPAPKSAPASVAASLRRQASLRSATPAFRIWLALATVYLLWGSTYLCLKFSIETILPLLMGSLRFLVAGAVLYAIAIRTGDTRGDRVGSTQWLAALFIGGAMLLGGNGGVILAEQHAPTGVVALLVGAPPAPSRHRRAGDRVRRCGLPDRVARARPHQPLRRGVGASRPGVLGKWLRLHPPRQAAGPTAGSGEHGDAVCWSSI